MPIIWLTWSAGVKPSQVALVSVHHLVDVTGAPVIPFSKLAVHSISGFAGRALSHLAPAVSICNISTVAT